MAADLIIQRYGDFAASLTVELDDVPMDSSLYTYDCKMRDSPQVGYTSKIYFLPGGAGTYLQLATSVDAGDPSKIHIAMDKSVTETLIATDGFRQDQWPLIDIEFTTISSGDVFFVPLRSMIVEIVETQSYG